MSKTTNEGGLLFFELLEHLVIPILLYLL